MARIVCQVLHRTERVSFIWSYGKASFEPYHLSGTALDNLHRLAKEAEARLAAAAATSDSAAAAALSELGHQLYQTILPDAAREVRDWLSSLQDRGELEGIEIVSDAPATIPWNILVDQPNSQEFWGHRYELTVGQRVNPWRQQALIEKPEVLLVIDPGLRNLLLEQDKNRLAELAKEKALPLAESREQLVTAFKSQPPDFIYVLCRDDAAGFRLGGDVITADELAALIEEERADPVIVLNRCGGQGIVNTASFLRAGLRGFVSGDVDVAPGAGNTFGLEFLSAFLYGGEPLGKALQKARRACGVPGLAYSAHCPGALRVTWEEGAEDESGPEPAPLPDKPYRPLAPYDREDRALFAGRDDDIVQFSTLLDDAETRVVLLHGASGVGKSSFLRAGVVPYLEDTSIGYRALRDRTPEEDTPVAEEEHAVLAIRAGHDLVGQLAEALCAFAAQPYTYTTPAGKTVTVDLTGIVRAAAHAAPSSTAIQDRSVAGHIQTGASEPAPSADSAAAEEVSPSELWRRLSEDPEALGRLIAQLTDRLPHSLVIVIEQVEELYSQLKNSVPARKRRQALEILTRAANTPSQAKWILSLRTDYFGRLCDDLPRGAQTGIREYLLAPLGDDDLLETVLLPTAAEPVPFSDEAPFAKYNFTFDEGLPRKIVSDVQQAARASHQSVLPLLQAVCSSLVDNLQARQDRVIRQSDLNDLGALEGALAKFADNKVKALPVTSQEQRALREMMDTLYTRQPDGALTRNLVAAQEIVNAWKGAQAGETVQHACAEDVRLLEVNRLLVAGREGDYVSLSQDALARVGEEWAEERRRTQYGRSRIIDMLWIFIPLMVLVAAVTMWLVRRGGATPDGKTIFSREQVENILEQQERFRVRSNNSLRYSINIALADRAWQAGSAFQAKHHLDAAFSMLPEAALTPFEWNYLKRLIESYRLELGKAGTVALTADSKLVAAAGADGAIKVFETAKGKLEKTLTGHRGRVRNLAFAGDSNTLVSGGDDGTVRLWDVAKGNETKLLKGHSGNVLVVAISKDGHHVASGSADKTAILWNVKEGKERFTLKDHSAAVAAVAFDPEGKMLATADAERALFLWDAESGKRLKELKGHTGPINAVAFAPDSKKLASGGQDVVLGEEIGVVRQWDLAADKEIGPPIRHGVGVFTLVYSRDGKMLFTTGKDEAIRVWDAKSGAALAVQPADNDWIKALALSSDGETLATAGDAVSLRLWSTAQILSGNVLRGHEDAVEAVAFAGEGKFVVSGSRDRTLRFWDADSGKLLHTMDKLEGSVSALAVWGKQKETLRIAAALNGKEKTEIKIWEIDPAKSFAAKELHTLKDHTAAISALAASRDGKLLASTSYDKTARVWETDTGKLRHVLKDHKGAVLCAAWSATDHVLATSGDEVLIRLWNPETGKLAGVLPPQGGHAGAVTSLVLLPRANVTIQDKELPLTRLVSGSHDHSLRLWFLEALEAGLAPRIYREHGGPVTAIAVHPQTRLLVSAGWDHVLKSWSLDANEERFAFTGHTGPVRALAIAPDGRTIASASHDGTVRLWRSAAPMVRPAQARGPQPDDE